MWIYAHLNHRRVSVCVPAEGIHALSIKLLGFSVRRPDFRKWGHLASNVRLVYIEKSNSALGLTEFAVEPPWHGSAKFAWPAGIGEEIVKKTLCEICAGSEGRSTC
jgi:hypothetical protein